MEIQNIQNISNIEMYKAVEKYVGEAWNCFEITSGCMKMWIQLI